MIDTRSFMIAAYTVATLIYTAYVVSLWMRARRLREKLAMLVEANARPGVDRDPSHRPG